MWRFWILLCTAFLAESQKIEYLQMLFGEELSIKLPTVNSLEFTSVNESEKYTVWAFGFGKRGTIKGSKSKRRFVINHVNFEDQGTYIRRNIFKTMDYIAKVKVLPKKTSWVCVRGDTCSISLNGIEKEKASMRFSNDNLTLMLVDRGSPVKNLPDYIGRIKVTSSSVQVLNFNVSDEGNYVLYDGQDRKAVTTRIFLSEPHDGIDASPLFSLLLLLGIPVGVCCCCRKKLKIRRSQATGMNKIQAQSILSPPGPLPDYNNIVNPAGPVPTYTPGYPAPGESKDPPSPDPPYPVPVQPQYGGEPAMPPQGPASGYPPAQFPLWTGPPFYPTDPATYTPGYPASGDSQVHPPPANPLYPPLPQSGQPTMPPNNGFTPVMCNVPAGSETEDNKGGIKMGGLSPTAPLLWPSQSEVGLPPAPYTGTDVLNSNSSTVQFNSNSYNFL